MRVKYALWVNGLPHLFGSDLTPEAVDKMLMAHRGRPLDDMDEINALVPIPTAVMPAWMTPYCPSERQVFTHIARRVDGLAATFCGLRGNDALSQKRVFVEDMKIPTTLCPRCEAQALEESKE